MDRYGLTKSRLQKHKSAAMGFVEKFGKHQVSSEAATKYQKRIDKYGYRLFTFLDYDRVPWHNNNAEHAIHAFARYRRFADGRFTRKSVSDYLAILTCLSNVRVSGRKRLGLSSVRSNQSRSRYKASLMPASVTCDSEKREPIFLQCKRPLLAHSVALNPFCQGLLIEGEADTNAAAR